MLVQKFKPKAHRPQRYHGHTIIELRNARTGIRDRVEHDNDFTLGIDQYLTDGGFFNNSPFANETWRNQVIYRNLIGGVLLFDKEIEAVNGVLPTIMPAGTKMVANGSWGVTNSGSPTELGSFNSSESSANESAITMVYDWPTQHACNIECVSLTSDVGGYVGYGNSASNGIASARSLILNQSTTSVQEGQTNYGNFLKDNYRYVITAHTANNFTYTKKRTSISEVSLFPSEKTYTVSLPASMVAAGVASYVSAGRDGRFYIIPSSLTTGRTHIMGIYDTSTDSWSTVSFSVPSAVSANGEYTSVCDDFIYVWKGTAWSNDGLRINFDGSVQTVSYGVHCTPLHENLLLCLNYSSRDNFNTFVVDLENNTSYQSNGFLPATYKNLKTLGDNKLEIDYYGNSQMNYFYLYRNPLYLATINNLDEPVTKTTTQTMKVTYTVTPA